MYSSRLVLSVPAIGDKAHQLSLFEATTTNIPNSAARPVGSHMAWLTELEIDGFK